MAIEKVGRQVGSSQLTIIGEQPSEIIGMGDEYRTIQALVSAYFDRAISGPDGAAMKAVIKRVVNIPDEPRCWTKNSLLDPATRFLLVYKSINPTCFENLVSDREWKSFLCSRRGQALKNEFFSVPGQFTQSTTVGTGPGGTMASLTRVDTVRGIFHPWTFFKRRPTDGSTTQVC